MKKRRFLVISFMLVAALLVGVGYAAVTNVLDIQGSASVSATDAEKEFNEDIYFAGVVKDGNPVDSIDSAAGLGYTANINSNNNDKAQFTITGIAKTDDSQSITYRIKNDSEHVAKVTLKSMTNTEEGIFGFKYYFGTEGTTETEIAAGETVDVTVVVSLDTQPTAAASASFVIELNATAGETTTT